MLFRERKLSNLSKTVGMLRNSGPPTTHSIRCEPVCPSAHAGRPHGLAASLRAKITRCFDAYVQIIFLWKFREWACRTQQPKIIIINRFWVCHFKWNQADTGRDKSVNLGFQEQQVTRTRFGAAQESPARLLQVRERGSGGWARL